MSGYADSVASGESEGLLRRARRAGDPATHSTAAPRQALWLGLRRRPDPPRDVAVRRPVRRASVAARSGRADPDPRRARRRSRCCGSAPEVWGSHSALRGVELGPASAAGQPGVGGVSVLRGADRPRLAAGDRAVQARRAARARLRACASAAPRPGDPRGRGPGAGCGSPRRRCSPRPGFSGSDRYLIAPIGTADRGRARPGGPGAVARAPEPAAREPTWRSHRCRRRPACGTRHLVALLAVTALLDAGHLANLATTASRQRAGAALRAEVATAVRRAGGARRLTRVRLDPDQPVGGPARGVDAGDAAAVDRERRRQRRDPVPERSVLSGRAGSRADADSSPARARWPSTRAAAAEPGGPGSRARRRYGVRLARASIHT